MMGKGNPMYGKPNPYKGVKRSEEVRLKISLGHKGKKFTEEHRRNLSLAKKGKPNLKRRGANHPLWKGGVTPANQKARESIENINWKRAVLARDDYTCQVCGKRGGKLQVDHIKPFAFHRHLRYVIGNGRTLCEQCHRKTDTYGYRKNPCLGRRALIFGISGQDGSYLAEFLLDRGYKVGGMMRRSSSFNTGRIDHIRDQLELFYGDITDAFSVINIIKKFKPDEIYQLSAQSHVQVSWENPWLTAQITGVGMLNVLEAVRVLDMDKKVKIYNASTSEMFSGLEGHKQNEDTPKNPVSPYGSAKLYAYNICKNYRTAFGMFVASGLLFNHESPRRGDNFVTKKITDNADFGEVKLGNIDASRDWGFSPEYCEAMWLILQQDKPDDFVIATGETHTIKEFVQYTEKACGHKIKILHGKEYDRPTDVPVLCGDASKAERVLGWKPIVKAEELAKIMYNDGKL